MISKSEMTVIYELPYAEFKEWAVKQSWIRISTSEQDFGEKQTAHHARDTTVLGQIYDYMTPMGIKVAVLIENEKVKATRTNITD
jgi:hypothetical protein